MNGQMGEEGGIASGETRATTVCLAVYAHVVPDDATNHAVLLGRDSWADFPARKYVDTNNTETEVTFSARVSGTDE